MALSKKIFFFLFSPSVLTIFNRAFPMLVPVLLVQAPLIFCAIVSRYFLLSFLESALYDSKHVYFGFYNLKVIIVSVPSLASYGASKSTNTPGILQKDIYYYHYHRHLLFLSLLILFFGIAAYASRAGEAKSSSCEIDSRAPGGLPSPDK